MLLKVPVMVVSTFLITPDVSQVAAKITKDLKLDMMLKFIELESLECISKNGLTPFGMTMMMVLNIKKDSADGINV